MTSTYRDRIEEKKKRAAEDIARLEREAEIAAQLPVGAGAPEHIMLGGSFDRCPWLCYKVKTPADACALIRAFPEPAEVSAMESGCLSIQPPELQRDPYAKGRVRWIEPAAVEVRQSGGRGFFSCDVSFWTQDCAGLPWAHVKIDVESLDYRLRAVLTARYDRYGNVERAEFRDSEPMRAGCAQRVKFGSGSADSFEVRYFFSGADRLEAFLRNWPER